MAIDKASLDSLRIDRVTETTSPRKAWWLVAGVALIAALGLVAWLIVRPARANVRVVAARALRGETKSTVLNATGYVTARRAATVSSKFTGRVIDVYVEEGMRVIAGQVLARLDAAIPQHALQLARAQAQAASSALQETKVRMEQ